MQGSEKLKSSNTSLKSRKLRTQLTKVKTGCKTCRVRKVKCDEQKPYCNRCVSTGRSCDGYETVFRPCQEAPRDITPLYIPPSNPLMLPTFLDQSYHSISFLASIMTIKSEGNYDVEAREALQASQVDLAVRHAILSLGSLNRSAGDLGDIDQTTPGFRRGLQEYNTAVRCLAIKLATDDRASLQSALICCRLFISIEVAQGRMAGAITHFIRGLKIMHDYHARPSIDDKGNFVPAALWKLPLLDLFILKALAARCPLPLFDSIEKMRNAPEPTPVSDESPLDQNQMPTPVETSPVATTDSTDTPRNLVKIAPAPVRPPLPPGRVEIIHISNSAILFLDQVTAVKSTEDGLLLKGQKANLLDQLRDWKNGYKGVVPQRPFLRLFHATLKVVVTLALVSSQRIFRSLDSELIEMLEIGELLSTEMHMTTHT